MRNLLLSLAATALLAAPASAQLKNLGFEAGAGALPAHWITTPVAGRATSITNDIGTTVTPCSGNWFGFASFGPGAAGDPGSLTQTAFLAKGQTVRGCVGFLGGDYDPYDDQGYFSVFDGNVKTDIFGSGIVTSMPGTAGAPPVGDFGWTGWLPWSYTASLSGAHTFELGAFNVGDNLANSWAVLDTVIPEPATWAMMIAGFGLVGFAARRRRLQMSQA
jgi:hypothetical protein